MNYAQILNVISLAIPVLIAGTKKIVKGNEKYFVAIAVYFVLKRFAEAAAVSEAREKIQEPGGLNSNALAQLYRQALNPSGYSILMDLDGTNEDLIFDLASRTPNFQAVALSYKSLYKSDLSDDLRKELSSSDFEKFLTILNGL